MPPLFVLFKKAYSIYFSLMYNMRQAIEVLESGNWCSLRFITANMAARKGGAVMELAKCRITRNKPTGGSNLLLPPNAHGAGTVSRSANHHANFTRNVELQNKQVVKVHPILITHINNIAVV